MLHIQRTGWVWWWYVIWWHQRHCKWQWKVQRRHRKWLWDGNSKNDEVEEWRWLVKVNEISHVLCINYTKWTENTFSKLVSYSRIVLQYAALSNCDIWRTGTDICHNTINAHLTIQTWCKTLTLSTNDLCQGQQILEVWGEHLLLLTPGKNLFYY